MGHVDSVGTVFWTRTSRAESLFPPLPSTPLAPSSSAGPCPVGFRLRAKFRPWTSSFVFAAVEEREIGEGSLFQILGGTPFDAIGPATSTDWTTAREGGLQK